MKPILLTIYIAALNSVALAGGSPDTGRETAAAIWHGELAIGVCTNALGNSVAISATERVTEKPDKHEFGMRINIGSKASSYVEYDEISKMLDALREFGHTEQIHTSLPAYDAVFVTVSGFKIRTTVNNGKVLLQLFSEGDTITGSDIGCFTLNVTKCKEQIDAVRRNEK